MRSFLVNKHKEPQKNYCLILIFYYLIYKSMIVNSYKSQKVKYSNIQTFKYLPSSVIYYLIQMVVSKLCYEFVIAINRRSIVAIIQWTLNPTSSLNYDITYKRRRFIARFKSRKKFEIV